MSSFSSSLPKSLVRSPSRHRTIRRNAVRLRRSSRALTPGPIASAWCVDPTPIAGTGLIAGWLLATITTLVAHYSRPGSRVLLLTPPPVSGEPVRWTSTAPAPTPNNPFAGLHEAAWTVLRLGRRVHTAAASITDADHPAGPDHPTADQFDLIIACVEPRSTGWVRQTRWAAMLAPHGVIAIVTHGRIEAGQWHDPLTTLTRTLTHRQLSCLDHIALISPPSTSLGDDPEVHAPTDPYSDGRDTTRPAHCRRDHHDLLLFVHHTDLAAASTQDGQIQ